MVIAEPAPTRHMAKRKPSAEDTQTGGQVNFRASKELWDRLQSVCEGLGLDLANLCRMVVIENLPKYEDRVRRIHSRDDESRDP